VKERGGKFLTRDGGGKGSVEPARRGRLYCTSCPKSRRLAYRREPSAEGVKGIKSEREKPHFWGCREPGETNTVNGPNRERCRRRAALTLRTDNDWAELRGKREEGGGTSGQTAVRREEREKEKALVSGKEGEDAISRSNTRFWEMNHTLAK